jgi:RNA polymerase sigma-70 factor, ECF subfamily
MSLPSSMTAMSAAADPKAEAPPASQEAGAVLPSFRSIYDDYFDFVWTCARRLGVPIDAIDDVVQEVFVVVHARSRTVERPASLRSWIYGVVRRTVSTYHRGRRARNAREAPDAADDAANAMQPSPLDLAVVSDELRLLWRLLGELGPLKREVFILAELEEMTMPEIAEAIEVPLNTAYSRLRGARQEFSEAFARYAAQQKGGR